MLHSVIFYPWLCCSGVDMEHLKELLDEFSPEQLSDIERFVSQYEQIPQDKRNLFVLIINAYIEGLMTGSGV